jgi:hypothetical protein
MKKKGCVSQISIQSEFVYLPVTIYNGILIEFSSPFQRRLEYILKREQKKK